ncbi:hypothetical protein GE061_001226 [Apolygus lucorum]|uniref:Uncharacterized protein n=1 Tax=Apolygus lucorum TaxID=248454 RepID=A0A6A4IQW8_APOLU|nr:hypothetical protein GE061_001226 [Apolygus lucorum]
MAHAIFSGPHHPTEMETAYWFKIDKYHLSYLHAEESPQKIHEKERLENVIKGFLGRIPHNRKFFISTTAQIFHKSVTKVKNFSIVKLSNAWTVIGLYAQNLISQPWRKEFHKIQMYSGYYEHNVRNILIGGEHMLMYMGYEHVGDGVMYLEGPVDPDRVALVSKDCFIASTECQVMFQIYSEMISRSNSVTYEDIFHFREQNICDTNKAIFELSVPHQRPISMYSTMGLPYSSSSCSRTLSHRASTMKEPFNLPYQWHDGHYLPNEAHNNYSTVIPSPNIAPHHMYPTNGFSYPHEHRPYYQPMPVYPNSVPTGQLIEYDSTHVRNYPTEKSHKRNSSEPLKHDSHLKEDEADSRHSRELVQNWLCYEELASERKEMARKVCEEMTKVKLGDVSPHESRGAKKKEKKSTKDPCSTSRLPSARQPLEPEPPTYQKTNKSRSHPNTNHDVMWECSKCTYHNKPNVDVCEMCDKSRIQGNECLPLISGGRECHTCTLVNERGEEKCKACGECLKDSPTYI